MRQRCLKSFAEKKFIFMKEFGESDCYLSLPTHNNTRNAVFKSSVSEILEIITSLMLKNWCVGVFFTDLSSKNISKTELFPIIPEMNVNLSFLN